jgi:hypothetical protein
LQEFFGNYLAQHFEKLYRLDVLAVKPLPPIFLTLTPAAPVTLADKKDALNRIVARPFFGFCRQKIGIAPFS